MDKCPFCGAETRPGDNFCLNCGNRLLPSTPSPSAQQPVGESTLAAPEDWGAALSGGSQLPPTAWADSGGSTIASSDSAGSSSPNWGSPLSAGSGTDPTVRDAPAATAQATMDKIEQPARFILRSDTGEVLQEYLLEKPEITIGRAPNSDVLLSKDKLTSRRHATVRYENGKYILRDERSANGTFVNGQQIEELTPYEMHDGDHIGIGEHELVFRAFGSSLNSVEDMPTVAVPFNSTPPQEVTYRTEDELATVPTNDDFGTRPVEGSEEQDAQLAAPPATPIAPGSEPVQPSPTPVPAVPVNVWQEPAPTPPPPAESAPVQAADHYSQDASNGVAESASNVTFNRLLNMPLPTLPDMSELQAALSALDGQVMSLQSQINTTQDALRTHETEVAQVANQLRTGIRQVSERMDKTIADVARSREALAWAELSQLMEDVMTNPRDIEYVTKLARKARELNKVFQIHQSVLNTMAECNSLLRSLIGEEK